MSMVFLSTDKSLKALLAIFRKEGDNYANKTYVSTRINPLGDGERYQFTINDVMTPSMPVESYAEGLAKTQNAFHAYGSLWGSLTR
jgi:hypothetical protein